MGQISRNRGIVRRMTIRKELDDGTIEKMAASSTVLSRVKGFSATAPLATSAPLRIAGGAASNNGSSRGSTPSGAGSLRGMAFLHDVSGVHQAQRMRKTWSAPSVGTN